MVLSKVFSNFNSIQNGKHFKIMYTVEKNNLTIISNLVMINVGLRLICVPWNLDLWCLILERKHLN